MTAAIEGKGGRKGKGKKKGGTGRKKEFVNYKSRQGQMPGTKGVAFYAHSCEHTWVT